MGKCLQWSWCWVEWMPHAPICWQNIVSYNSVIESWALTQLHTHNAYCSFQYISCVLLSMWRNVYLLRKSLLLSILYLNFPFHLFTSVHMNIILYQQHLNLLCDEVHNNKRWLCIYIFAPMMHLNEAHSKLYAIHDHRYYLVIFVSFCVRCFSSLVHLYYIHIVNFTILTVIVVFV